jgi:hypothetical protein
MLHEDACSAEVAHVISYHEKYGGKMYEWRKNISRRILNYGQKREQNICENINSSRAITSVSIFF